MSLSKLIIIIIFIGKEPEFLLNQPYLCPLIAHFIAMSIVCWNPILFYWLSAKDKVGTKI